MDSFVEQLIEIKAGRKILTLKISIWIVCTLMTLGLIAFAVINKGIITFLLLTFATVVMFIAYHLTTQLNIEFEYILTNDEIDVDRIINKSKRERLATFKCHDIEDISIYDRLIHVPDKANNKNVYIGCDLSNGTPLAFRIKHPKNGYYTLVLTPNETFKQTMKKFLPYLLRDKV